MIKGVDSLYKGIYIPFQPRQFEFQQERYPVSRRNLVGCHGKVRTQFIFPLDEMVKINGEFTCMNCSVE
jgi:hypothetical protein